MDDKEMPGTSKDKIDKDKPSTSKDDEPQPSTSTSFPQSPSGSQPESAGNDALFEVQLYNHSMIISLFIL
jgi:hypothetical protein